REIAMQPRAAVRAGAACDAGPRLTQQGLAPCFCAALAVAAGIAPGDPAAAQHDAAFPGHAARSFRRASAAVATPQASKNRPRLKRGFSAWHTLAKRATSCATSASFTDGQTRRQSRTAAAILLKCLLLMSLLFGGGPCDSSAARQS